MFQIVNLLSLIQWNKHLQVTPTAVAYF